MWCRAENLCFSLRNGLEEMWLATESGLTRLDEHSDFMASNLRVMKGDAHSEADKQFLVLPILGLYAQLYAWSIVNAESINEKRSGSAANATTVKISGHHPGDRGHELGARVVHHKHGPGVVVKKMVSAATQLEEVFVQFDSNVAHRYDNTSIHKLLPEGRHKALMVISRTFKARVVTTESHSHWTNKTGVFLMIQANKQEILPKEIRLERTSRRQPTSYRQTSERRSGGSTSGRSPHLERYTLFGDLVEMMEARIQREPQLQTLLVEQEVERLQARGQLIKSISALSRLVGQWRRGRLSRTRAVAYQ